MDSYREVIHSGWSMLWLTGNDGSGELAWLCINRRRLKPGARIGVVAPAGCVDADALRRGIEAIAAEGFEVELGAGIYAQTRVIWQAARSSAPRIWLTSFAVLTSTRYFARAAALARFNCCHYLSSRTKKLPENFCRLQRYHDFAQLALPILRHGDISRANGCDGYRAGIERTGEGPFLARLER